MTRIPIYFKKVFTEFQTGFGAKRRKELKESFLIKIDERNRKWDLSYEAGRSDLIKLRNSINEELGFIELAQKLECNIEEAEKISSYQLEEEICDNCSQKNLSCYDCIFTCQSPLEQKLYVALRNEKIKIDLQARITKDGQIYSKEYPVNRKTILTLPDFYIDASNKVCIYADGHTYHERTERQALRDRNIDRELQNLGFKVLRFTGKEIRETIENVVETIKKSI